MFLTLTGIKCSIGEGDDPKDAVELKMCAITAIVSVGHNNDQKQIYKVFDDKYLDENINQEDFEVEVVVDVHRVNEDEGADGVIDKGEQAWL